MLVIVGLVVVDADLQFWVVPLKLSDQLSNIHVMSSGVGVNLSNLNLPVTGARGSVFASFSWSRPPLVDGHCKYVRSLLVHAVRREIVRPWAAEGEAA